MVTDPQRIRKDDPGHPNVCIVYKFQTIFNPDESEEICFACTEGKIGCVACKKKLAKILVNSLEPVYEKRKEIEVQKGYVEEVLEEGSKKASTVAEKTMEDVRDAMKIYE